MIQRPQIPPAYRLVTLKSDIDLGPEARRMAVEGADDGTLLWVTRDDKLDCAVILHPDDPLERAVLVSYVAMLGLNDGLGVVVPPMTEVTFSWPNRIEANGAVAGAIGIDVPNEAALGSVPDWLVVYATVAVAPPVGSDAKLRDPASLDKGVTTLREEGCSDVTPADILEAFARHFLTWVNRWQDDGFEPIRARWLQHAPDNGKAVDIDVGGEKVAGTFVGIDDDGSLILDSEGASRRVGLGDVLFASRQGKRARRHR